MLLQNRIFKIKSNITLNMTKYFGLTDLDVFESIMLKRSNWRSEFCVYVGTCFMCLLKVLKIVWSSWNKWNGINQLVFYHFSKLMKVIIEVVDLWSQIVFLIRIDDDIKMLHAKFQHSMTMFRTKWSLCTIYCH